MLQRMFYRLVLGTQPTPWDFMSHAERGVPLRPPLTARRRRMHQGVSIYDSLDAAFARLQRIQPEHRGIAALVFDEASPFEIEQTTSDPRHHTVWATAEDLQRRVQWILRVERLEQRTP